MCNNDSIFFTIEREIGRLAEYSTGWNKELNIVAWNGSNAKYDIRDWSPDHTGMSRGITLHELEARKLYELLKAEFESEV